MSLLAIAPEIPTQTPGVLAPQKYKSWLTIDSKNSNVTEIVSQLGIASALFSAGETRVKKSRGGAGNFYLVGHIWGNGYLSYWRDSANSVACVAGAKRGREMGREKSTKEGKGKGGSLPLSPLPPPFSLFPYPLPLSTPATHATMVSAEGTKNLMTFSSWTKNFLLSLKIINCHFILAFNTWFEKVLIDIKFLACEQALHLGDIVKSTRARTTREETRLSRLRRSLARSRAARFACPNRRACSQAIKFSKGILPDSAIQWITKLVFVILIHWILFYPVDSDIRLLNNRGLD